MNKSTRRCPPPRNACIAAGRRFLPRLFYDIAIDIARPTDRLLPDILLDQMCVKREVLYKETNRPEPPAEIRWQNVFDDPYQTPTMPPFRYPPPLSPRFLLSYGALSPCPG